MTIYEKTLSVAIVFILIILLTACQSANQPRPEPEIRTVEVMVPVQAPCQALKDLGAEPVYPDTNEAVKTAPNVFERAKLFARGRLMRIARLAQYSAAKASCL